MNAPLRIVLVGSGNVASRLLEVIVADPVCEVVLVVSRTLENARRLVECVRRDIPTTDDYSLISTYHPDIVLISVADNAIDAVVANIGSIETEPLVLHTSGTLNRNLLSPVSSRTGVLYPLQTFTKGREVDIRKVPVFIEAEQDKDLELIRRLATAVSERVELTSPEQRKTLHIAGVMTNNFTNILLEQVEKLLRKDGYSLDVVRPLIEETVSKAFALGPHAAQTGPAKRGDRAVINEHIEALPKELKEIYSALSELIIQSHHE